MTNIFGKIDRAMFWTAIIISGIFVGWAVITPQGMTEDLGKILKFFTEYFGWLFISGVTIFLAFCLILAFSKYGDIKLGKDEDEPEYSTYVWIAMLFSAGMGIGLVFWGIAEPMTYFGNPPFGEANSPEAAAIAMRYSFFHWGLHPWCMYAVVAMSLGYFQYRKGLPGLVSSCLYPILGEKGIKGPIGRGIDSFVVVTTLFGLANILGMGSMQINSGLNFVYGLPNNTAVTLGIIAVLTAMFCVSSAVGIEKGMKFLSKSNMVLFFSMMAFMLVFGPTRYIINMFFETLGQYFHNIVWMSLYLDATGTVAQKVGYNWVGSWTIFYWTWWIGWAPFVGGFIAKISKGRTIREFVLAVLFAPSLLSFVWFAITGGLGMDIDLNGAGGIAAAVAKDVSSALFVALSHLPIPAITSTICIGLILTFFLTSADSATSVLGQMTSGGDLNPSKASKVLWGVIEGAVGAIIVVTGGVNAVKSVSVAFGFPIMIIMLVMLYPFVKAMNEDLIKNQFDKKSQ